MQMSVWFTVFSVLVIALWLFFNIVVAVSMSKTEMYEDLVEGQNAIGKVCANSFYCLAWLMKKCYTFGVDK
jgi:hypothetical protein